MILYNGVQAEWLYRYQDDESIDEILFFFVDEVEIIDTFIVNRCNTKYSWIVVKKKQY
jgi:hypothetical protein